MSRRPLLVACTSVMVAVSAISAAAGPKKVCNLALDSRNDATRLYANGVNGSNVPALDVLSTDVASNSSEITTVVRLAQLTTTDNSAPLGMAWRVSFNVGEFELYTKAMVDRAGAATYEYGYVENAAETVLGSTNGKVVLDTTAKEVRVTVPVLGFVTKAAPSVGKKGVNLTTLTYRSMVDPLVDSQVDDALSKASYTFGAPSCVVVGK